MINFWDSDVWSWILLFAVLTGSLLVGNTLRRKIPILRNSLIPTSVIGGAVLLIVAAIYKAITGNVMFDTAIFGGNGPALSGKACTVGRTGVDELFDAFERVARDWKRAAGSWIYGVSHCHSDEKATGGGGGLFWVRVCRMLLRAVGSRNAAAPDGDRFGERRSARPSRGCRGRADRGDACIFGRGAVLCRTFGGGRLRRGS